MLQWTAPPTRREITIVLFAFATFVLAFNVESSVRLLGLDSALLGGSTARLWGTRGRTIGPDGRKTSPWRDRLEKEIFGDWRWDQNHVAGDGSERQQEQGSNRYGAIWTGKVVTAESTKEKLTVSQSILPWGEEIPRTELVQHVPGYTILDGVVFVNGTLFIVTDNPSSLPPISSIASSSRNPGQPPEENDWQVLSPTEAKERLGNRYASIYGVTWLAEDSTPHNHTLISLWRTYASLDPNITSDGLTVLAEPRRLLIPGILTFSDPSPEFQRDVRRRIRSHAGFHPHLAKGAFPTLNVMYTQDWADFKNLGLPFRFQRLVVADRAAAARAAAAEGHSLSPPFVGPFEQLSCSPYWWEPIRRNLWEYVGLKEDPKAATKTVITYLNRQHETRGPRLHTEDHGALVSGLQRFAGSHGYEVHVVSENQTDWREMMSAIMRSTIIMGEYGPHLTDSVFIKPSQRTTLMEFFPAGTFIRDQEIPARHLGTKYIAWQNDRYFTSDSLPPVFRPEYSRPQEVRLDVSAVLKAVEDALR